MTPFTTTSLVRLAWATTLLRFAHGQSRTTTTSVDADAASAHATTTTTTARLASVTVDAGCYDQNRTGISVAFDLGQERPQSRQQLRGGNNQDKAELVVTEEEKEEEDHNDEQAAAYWIGIYPHDFAAHEEPHYWVRTVHSELEWKLERNLSS